MVRLTQFYNFNAAQKQSWQTLPALHQLHSISIVLPIPSVFLLRKLTNAPQKVTYNHYFNYDSQYPKYFMGPITKPASFQVSQSCKDQKCNTEMRKLVAKSMQGNSFTLGMPSKILQSIGKLCVEVHITDLISTTYHYASKVWLIFWRRERLQNILFIYVEGGLNFFEVHSIPCGVEGIHLFLNLKKIPFLPYLIHTPIFLSFQLIVSWRSNTSLVMESIFSCIRWFACGK